MQKIIDIKNLVKVYKSSELPVKAIDNVSICIEEGKFIVIFGNSGSGKSTMLNILGGIDSFTSGSVNVDGYDLGKSSNKELTRYRKEKISIIFQQYNLLSDLTGIENIKLAGNYDKSKINIDELIDKLDIRNIINKFPYQMSGGQQQRIAIARAFAKNSNLILCDEPTAALDSENAKNVIKLLLECNKKYYKTVIMVTHNSEIRKIADISIRMKDGKIASMNQNANPIDIEGLEL